MDDQRIACAAAALAPIPEDYCAVTAADVASLENGHAFHRALHIGWAWGEDEDGRVFLELLWEHRMTSTCAGRFFADGTSEDIDVPYPGYVASRDPVEDTARERRALERNRHVYADLRARGLLPESGANVPSQDINEFLQSGGRVEGE